VTVVADDWTSEPSSLTGTIIAESWDLPSTGVGRLLELRLDRQKCSSVAWPDGLPMTLTCVIHPERFPDPGK
jgi:hypothetical protein